MHRANRSLYRTESWGFPKIDALELFRRARDEPSASPPDPMFATSNRYRNCTRVGCGHLWSAKMEMSLMRFGKLAQGLT